MKVQDFKIPTPDGFQFKVSGINVTAVGQCTCGGGPPMILPLFPGVKLTTTCPACGTLFDFVGVSFDQRQPGEIKTAIMRQIPAIVKPGA